MHAIISFTSAYPKFEHWIRLNFFGSICALSPLCGNLCSPCSEHALSMCIVRPRCLLANFLEPTLTQTQALLTIDRKVHLWHVQQYFSTLRKVHRWYTTVNSWVNFFVVAKIWTLDLLTQDCLTPVTFPFGCLSESLNDVNRRPLHSSWYPGWPSRAKAFQGPVHPVRVASQGFAFNPRIGFNAVELWELEIGNWRRIQD